MSNNLTGIEPHGGRLVNRTLPAEARAEGRARAASLPVVDVSSRGASDLLLLATGAFSPLEGFTGYDASLSTVRDFRLQDGMLWPFPILLQMSQSRAESLPARGPVALRYGGELVGALEVEERFRIPLREWARPLFQTDEQAHPGVAAFLSGGDFALAGPVEWFGNADALKLTGPWRTPGETRKEIGRRGWRKVAGFQTRNPIHRAHEYVLRATLEVMDGLLLHPLVGETRPQDIPVELRLRCYQALLDHYLPRQHVLFGVFPAWMRYGGPREAVLHALARKNFGCTHFIVGRDHAGVGNYYGPFDAHRLLERLSSDGLGIQPLFFEEVYYCRRCGSLASQKSCGHGPQERLSLSGTEVRQRLREGLPLPVEFTRPEVAALLAESFRPSRQGAVHA